MADRCPHCSNETAVPILYGYRFFEEENVERGDVVLGGCVVERNDPHAACRTCGSYWTSSDDLSTSAITPTFAEYFANWNIELPAGVEAAATRGRIRKAGWLINYLFD